MGRWAWHVHHETLVERLEEGGISGRRRYIRDDKPPDEVPLRLALLKLVKGRMPKLPQWLDDVACVNDLCWPEQGIGRAEARRAWEQITALHEKECPGCPWDGESIFNHPRKAARLLASKA